MNPFAPTQLPLDAPIFIGGMFKSGTSLLRAMLGQHSRIASGLETYWFDLDLAKGGPDDHIVRIARLFDADIDVTRTQANASASAEQFLDRFMERYASGLGKPRWAEKTPGNVTHLARILRHWPRARILHIIRDPRDIFASLAEAGKAENAEQFVRRWLTIMPHAEAHKGGKDLTDRALLELRYEDLIARPEATMRGVLDFVGEQWEGAAAQFTGKHDEYEKVLRITGKASSTLDRLRQPISDDRVGLWRTTLGEEGTRDLLGAAERLGCGSLMRRIIDETPPPS